MIKYLMVIRELPDGRVATAMTPDHIDATPNEMKVAGMFDAALQTASETMLGEGESVAHGEGMRERVRQLVERLMQK